MTAPVGRLVPVVDEPEPTAVDDRSWDAFWAEHRPTQTTVVRGVTVLVPSGWTFAAKAALDTRTNDGTLAAWAEVACELFRAPDGKTIPGLWQQWEAAGMGQEELSVLVAWGLAHAGGNPITFAEAVKAREESGKDPAPTSGRSSASTGGRSKPASPRRTASKPTRSRA